MTSSLHSESPAFSVVIPAYNEQDRIYPYLDSIAAYFCRKQVSYEIIVVDDGSRDGTADGIEAYATRMPRVNVIRLPRNTGKGAAVRAGMTTARGRLRLMADADGATAIQELETLEPAIEHGADIAQSPLPGSCQMAPHGPGEPLQCRRAPAGDLGNQRHAVRVQIV